MALILLLGFFGGLTLVSAATGIKGLQISAGGPVFAYFEGDAARQIRGVFGAATLAWVYGVYRLYRLAWWVGVVVLAGLAIGIARDMVLMPPTAETEFDRSIGLLIWGIFLWWWSGQRNYFHK